MKFDTGRRHSHKAVPSFKTEKQKKQSLKIKVSDDPEFPEMQDLKPQFIIGFNAFIKLNLLCAKVDADNPGYEIGGGGLITNPKNGIYRLEDIFIPPQITQPAFNSLDFGELINQGIVKYRVKDARRVSFHFHKHPQSVTDFSGQDITQWHKILDFEQPFIFLLIFGHFKYDKWKASLVHPGLLASMRMNVGFDFPVKANLKVDLSKELDGIKTQETVKSTTGWSYGMYSPKDDFFGESDKKLPSKESPGWPNY